MAPSVTYKLLSVDLDGTLLRRDGAVHEEDARAVLRLQKRGIPVSIVTGRLFSGSIATARVLDLEGPIACVDGSHIVDARTDVEHVHQAITGDDAERLREILERHQTASFLFAHDAIVYDPRGDAFAPYVKTWSTRVTQVERVTRHPHWSHERGILAVVAVGADGLIAESAQEIREGTGDATYVVSFPVGRYEGVSALVVRARGPTKGTAVRWLAAHHGIGVEEVVVVGDWVNDVPMFEVAGRSFVMGQAPEDVKLRATDRLAADGTTGGGIAEAIARAWGL